MAQIIAEVRWRLTICGRIWACVAAELRRTDERLLSAAGGDERTQYALEKVLLPSALFAVAGEIICRSPSCDECWAQPLLRTATAYKQAAAPCG
jgi:hypothetical protein